MTPVTFHPVANSANVMFVNFANMAKRGGVSCLYVLCVREKKDRYIAWNGQLEDE